MSKFLRITRHPVLPAAEDWLRAKFGIDLEIVTMDVAFGDDPIGTVARLAAEVGEVVAAEVVAPLPILARLLGARSEITFPLLRAEFKRDATGRLIVAGTDEAGRAVFAFDRYVRLIRVSIETAEL
ncbi:MAG: hypothetical protein WC702_03215 [Patescibacteria group bacterium]|jgi:hypothetical protein